MIGHTLPEIMAALGHKTASMAARYVHLADSHKGEVASAVNARMEEWGAG